MKEKWIDAFIDTTERFAQCSDAERLKTGCIIVKNDNILAIGINGTPPNWESNICEHIVDGELVTKPEVLHAEENAILKLARGKESGEGATVFSTHSPCMHCARMIQGAGIIEVYYKTPYRLLDGIEFLEQCGINVIKVDDIDPLINSTVSNAKVLSDIAKRSV